MKLHLLHETGIQDLPDEDKFGDGVPCPECEEVARSAASVFPTSPEIGPYFAKRPDIKVPLSSLTCSECGTQNLKSSVCIAKNVRPTAWHQCECMTCNTRMVVYMCKNKHIWVLPIGWANN